MKKLTILVLLLALLGVACGGSDDNPTGQPDPDDGSAAPTPSADDEPTASSPSTTAADLDLPTTPISYASTFIDAWAGGAAPALDECPFLEEATIAAAMKNPDDVSLDRATSTSCDWTVFPVGFALTIEPASDVDVDNHSGRAYNIDVEPIVKLQDGPGEKAVLLVDSVSAETSESDGFEYAYFFVLDEWAVTIRSIGVNMAGADAWRTIADEVASNLASGAAKPGAGDAGADPCGFYATQDVAGFLATTEDAVAAVADPSRRWCEWTAGEYGKLAIGFYNAADVDEYVGSFADKIAEDGTDRSAELGVTAVNSLGGTYVYADTFDGAIYFRLEPVEVPAYEDLLALEAAIVQNLISRVS